MNPWNELLANLAVVAIATSLWTFGHRHVLRVLPRYKNLAFGFIMAAGTFCVMSLPFQFADGVFLDLRYTLLTIAGLFGGPVAALPPFLVAVTNRIMTGGMGLEIGLPLIVMATASGLIAKRFAGEHVPSGRTIVIIACAVVFSGTAGFFVKVPMARWSIVMPSVVLPFGFVLFSSSVVACLAMAQELKRYEATNLNRIYRAIIEALPDCLNAKDLEGRFIAANPATAALMGSDSADSLIGKTDFDFYPFEAATLFRNDEERLFENGVALTVEQRFIRRDGTEAWLSTLKAPFRDEQGTLIGVVTHNREITERKLLESQLVETKGRLTDALASMADGLAMFDANGIQILNNGRYLELFPLTADVRTNGTCMRTIIRSAIARGEETAASGNVDDLVERLADALLRPGDRQVRLADGRWLEARTRAAAEGGCLIVYSDITSAKQTEVELQTLNERLTKLASTDPLTGLLNRRAFDIAFDRIIASASRSNARTTLLMIDVDRFKSYNDTYGHPVGDACLHEVARAVSAFMESYPSSVVARYGGEEFCVIVPNVGSIAALSIAKLICLHVRSLGLVHAGSEKAVVTVSIGLASFDNTTGCNKSSLMNAADAALYQAKAAGRDCVRSVGDLETGAAAAQ